MRVSFAPEAAAEAANAAYWYREHGGSKTSQDFSQELQRITQLAAAQPELGQPGGGGSRRMPFKRFPYTLIYRRHHDTLRILAVAHQRRRPGYWTQRR